MKHNINLSLVFIFIFFFITIEANAASKYVTFLDSVNIREGAGTTYNVIKTGNVGSTYYLKNETIIPDVENGSCSSGWYEINYDGESAYICSAYVRVSTDEVSTTPTTACEIEMQEAGFPSSYWSGICSLKEKHPNWTFKAIITNLDWSTVVSKESVCGRSKIATTNSAYIDSSCHVDEGPFKGASQKAVAFYMDPRNFFTERYIFQFEYLRYEEALSNSYTNAIVKMLTADSFYKYHTEKGVEFASLVTTAGKEVDINPISLAARMHQEMGSGDSLYNLYSGIYTGGTDNEYYGYYNFYNIGVNSSCVNSITSCGLGYAKNYGWNTPYNAIKGGASLLSNSYLDNGQFTPYLQKFNIAPVSQNSLYLHQYMTNLAAPSSESSTSYNTYNNMGLIDSAFVFYIPVYTNMSATISNSANGAVDAGSSSAASTSSILSIINTAGYAATGEFITKITPGTTANILKDSLESLAGTGNVTITNSAGSVITNESVGTGYKVTIKNSSGSATFTVVIKGDTSGDGIINALDLLQVQKNILGTGNLTGAYEQAADPSGDGKINALDLLQVQKSILGTYIIVQ